MPGSPHSCSAAMPICSATARGAPMPAHDLDREAPVLRAAVIERLALPDVERILARLLVPRRVEPDAEARAESA